jgi:cysteinyl-tRNA synthetase
MPIHIYNSLTRKKEELLPLNPPALKIYTCGVTVYDESHIGHARSLYIFDVIRRYLAFRGFDVAFVRNITDIDDKIINRANELKTDWKELVRKYIDRYYEDLVSLGIGRADSEPRATENIPEMIRYITGLIEKGFAYESGGDVYFNVRMLRDYGKLSGQSIDAMETGVRIDPSEHKNDPLDFALWKRSKEGEPYWDSPWGKGRPGWHIECSVMSQKFLKTETLDIHAGGRDLIFPHHENEIAQAEALTGKPFAKYWIHHGLLTINAQKMSKSLGNFVTIKDFMTRYKNADLLKLFFLSAHYSHPIDYTEEKIEEARKQRNSFIEFFQKVDTWAVVGDKVIMPTSDSDKAKIEQICQSFVAAMDDDFNTPKAIASLFQLIDLGSGFISVDKQDAFMLIRNKLSEYFSILGLVVPAKRDIPDDAKNKLKEMLIAKKNKNFVESDKIRAELKSIGYAVSNTASSIAIIYVGGDSV